MSIERAPTHSRAQYNLVAKRLREQFPTTAITHNDNHDLLILRGQICELAIAFAKSFLRDNPERFDPIRFLDACSPDLERYPISELWENRSGEHGI